MSLVRRQDYWIATVSCGTQVHGIRLRNSTVTMLDHDDAEGELTLVALGGHASSPCGSVANAWLATAAEPFPSPRIAQLRMLRSVLTIGHYRRWDLLGLHLVRKTKRK